jgi:DNA-damage-inducible protein D
MSDPTKNQMDLAFPMTDTDVFHFDDSRPHFNALARENGITHWYAREFMEMLGYSEWSLFSKVINKALGVCITLNIPVQDNFQQLERDVNGRRSPDFKLSRFACYLVAMNGDARKPEIARAQAYFAVLAESFQRYVEQAEDVERVAIRDDITVNEKMLSKTAHAAGVQNYAFFQNAGYRGLYNMNLSDLKLRKGVVKGSVLDVMGGEELAANLFRITQTEARIKNQGIQGQRNLEQTAEAVGRTVRDTMINISGTRPETLPPARNIAEVRGDLKASSREFKKLDKKK